MDCLYVKNLFRSYINGNLDNEHSHMVRNHLTRCVTCRLRVRWLSISKVIPKIFLIIIVTSIATSLIIHLVNKKDSAFKGAQRKIISNIIIEVFSRDSEGDAKIVREFADKFGAKLANKDPVSIRLLKRRVNEFIEGLDKFLVFPDGTSRRVEEFINPLKESDIVVVKIKFLRKET